MTLFKPLFLALDTSHISQWIRDSLSKKEADRAKAREFSDWLRNSGSLPLFTVHHIEELCAYEDEATVLWRLRFLHSLPLVAWIPHGGRPDGPGGITSIMRTEVLAAFSEPNADITSVRNHAAQSLIHSGTGEDLLGPSPDDWISLRPEFLERTVRARNLVAVAHTNVVDLTSVPVAELINGRIRDDGALKRQLKIIEGSLAFDIAKHGDRRIADPRALAQSFVRQVAEARELLPDNAAGLVLQSLAALGIEATDLRQNTTLGEALEYGLYLQRMKISTQDATPPFGDLKRAVAPDRVPSWIMSSSLRRHAPPVTERKGSEFNDNHLACLAPYADMTLVDKRTWEAFRRAHPKEPLLAKVSKRVERAASYSEVPKMFA